MVCKRKKIKSSLSTIWEEEHSIFQFSKSVKELLKSRPPMVILPVVDKILMVLFKNIYSMSSKNNLALMSQRIKPPFKGSEKLLKRLK